VHHLHHKCIICIICHKCIISHKCIICIICHKCIICLKCIMCFISLFCWKTAGDSKLEKSMIECSLVVERVCNTKLWWDRKNFGSFSHESVKTHSKSRSTARYTRVFQSGLCHFAN
jgi:hypothetical protein